MSTIITIIGLFPYFAMAVGFSMILTEGRKTPETKYSGYKRANGEV